MQNGITILENSLTASPRVNRTLTCDPTISLPGIYPIEMKICVHTETCIQIFIEAIFIVEKNRGNLAVLQ